MPFKEKAGTRPYSRDARRRMAQKCIPEALPTCVAELLVQKDPSKKRSSRKSLEACMLGWRSSRIKAALKEFSANITARINEKNFKKTTLP
jgi:hypothetical protein